LRNNKGAALLVTLAVITILVAVTVELNRKARNTALAKSVHQDLFTLEEIAASGIHLGVAILVKDRQDSNVDGLWEDWSDPEKLGKFVKEIPFEKGALTLEITDELSRIQVNALVFFPEGQHFNTSQQIVWDRFLRNVIEQYEDIGTIEPITIINSIKDWIDSGDDEAITGLIGAESSFYASLDPPYECRNGPFSQIEELMRVRGMNKALFYGVKEFVGIYQHMTVSGISTYQGNTFTYEGKININTAPLPVLEAILPPEYRDLAQNIIEYRKQAVDTINPDIFINPMWYKQVPGLQEIEIDTRLITTSSNIFRIEATANIKHLKRKITAVVQREQQPLSKNWTCKILRWETE